MRLDVNTRAIIHLTSRLEGLHRSAFPSAVRSTLNDAAFEMKKVNIEASARRNMKVKNKTFFRKFTGVERARGFNVGSMGATVGFTDKGSKNSQKAVNSGMELNESGGSDSTGLMYTKKTRTGSGLVRRKDYYDTKKQASKYRSAQKKGNTIKRLYAGSVENKPVMISTDNGVFLVKVKSFKRGVGGGAPDIKLDFLMSDRSGKRTAKVKATHFNREAAKVTQKQIEGFYIKNAEFQFSKIWK